MERRFPALHAEACAGLRPGNAEGRRISPTPFRRESVSLLMPYRAGDTPRARPSKYERTARLVRGVGPSERGISRSPAGCG